MHLAIRLIIFVVIVLAVNNVVLYYAIQKRMHSRIHSVGLLIFLISLIEIVAIAIFAYLHLR
jgi:hypothetical protein